MITVPTQPNVFIIGPCPACQEFAAAWHAEIIRHKAGALARHIETCPTCCEWDRQMKEASRHENQLSRLH